MAEVNGEFMLDGLGEAVLFIPASENFLFEENSEDPILRISPASYECLLSQVPVYFNNIPTPPMEIGAVNKINQPFESADNINLILNLDNGQAVNMDPINFPNMFIQPQDGFLINDKFAIKLTNEQIMKSMTKSPLITVLPGSNPEMQQSTDNNQLFEPRQIILEENHFPREYKSIFNHHTQTKLKQMLLGENYPNENHSSSSNQNICFGQRPIKLEENPCQWVKVEPEIDYSSGIAPTYKSYQLMGDGLMLLFTEKILNYERPLYSEIQYCKSGLTIPQLVGKLKRNEFEINKEVILMIGANDLKVGASIGSMKYDYSALVKVLLTKCTNIVLLTLPPLPEFYDCIQLKANFIEFNAFIRRLKNNNNIFVVDLCHNMLDGKKLNMILYDTCYLSNRFGSPTYQFNLEGLKFMKYILDTEYFQYV